MLLMLAVDSVVKLSSFPTHPPPPHTHAPIIYTRYEHTHLKFTDTEDDIRRPNNLISLTFRLLQGLLQRV
jgi:hypothetical protein